MSITPYTFDLEPGGTEHQTFGESNYIFVDFADRTIEVLIGGSWQSLRKGSRYRSKNGVFSKMDIRNPDPDNPCRVIMFIGTDEVDNQIVEGEISIVPILRNADGTIKPDTRHTLKIDVAPSNLVTTAYTGGDVIAQASVGVRPDGFPYDNGERFVCRGFKNRLAFSNKCNVGGKIGLSILEFDDAMKQVSETFYETGATTPVSITYRPGVGYLYTDVSANPNRVIRLTESGPEVLAELPTDNHNATIWMPERQQFAVRVGGSNVELFDGAFSSVGLIEGIGFGDVIGYDANNNWLLVGEGGSNCGQYDFSGVRQGQVPVSAGSLQTGLFTINGLVYFANTEVNSAGATQPKLQKIAYRDFVTKPEFIARRPGCNLAGAFYKPNQIPQITADVTATELPAGVVLEGELIKAALEYYYRRKVGPGYLDHVYALDLSADGAGLPFRQIVTGNETFDRANVADDFATLTPGQILITVDNELPLGGLL